jgi:PAS domain S-box-containing protein
VRFSWKSWPHPSTSVRSVIVLGALLMVVVQGMTGYEIWRQYNGTITLAERNLNVLADVLTGEIGRTITGVDSVVEQSILDLSTEGSRSPEQIRRTLRDRAIGVPAIFGLMLIDQQGQAVASLHSLSARHQSFAQAIRTSVAGQNLPIHVGIVAPAPFDGTPIIPFSRLRHDAAGNIAGITVAAMSVQYFQEIFLQVKSRTVTTLTLTLARQDGAILVQTPEGTTTQMSDMAEFRLQTRDNGLIHDDDTSGRIVAFRTLRPYGLKLSAAVNTVDLLNHWRSNALRLVLAAVAASLVVAVLVWVILRRLAQDEAQRANLRSIDNQRRMALFSLDAGADMVVWTNDKGDIIYANPAAHQALGYAPGTLFNRTIPDIDPSVPPAAWEGRLDDLRRAGTLRFETSLLTLSGNLITVEVSIALLPVDGRDHTCAIIRDIGAHKRSEAVLAERTKRLEASNAELEQFAYVASHDLREPLRMVNSFVALLARRFGDQMDPEAREYVEFAREGALRMDRLILDLLEYSRVGSTGRLMAAVDLGAVLNDVRQTLALTLNEAGAELIVPASLPKVWGDADELARLLGNLIGNGLKYRHSDRLPRIEVGCLTQDGQITLSVRDNGIGIAPQYFDRIFRIFQRLHGREHYDGTGIGLAICKKIVERHGGRIWVSSTPDQGSTFFFTLKPAPAP